ncbi:small ribosomal subunit Rsm22 family protein [Arsenicicoccus sp. oral taxon 190]|uniref:small ribosomal subunit Rsm22 family protein n=1 Tax=Arsenicicoccus sp. oral taxon 190 TaxID=1658671 RepID=UPI000679F94C|nr:small ribosomal subunit Rsm22 family protein [Arsenicicoccus sp. oral taxon 190]AKT50697.1 hypothetical protein ADJ73_04125 [Arsenicicoccus sp. oral taxon 190]
MPNHPARPLHDPRAVADELRDLLAEALAGHRVDALAGRVTRLIEAYRSGSVPASVILADPVTVAAYSAYRMPATVAALGAVLEQASSAVPSLRVRRLVDLGGGTGAAGWAVAAWAPELEQVDVLEQSELARSLGARLARASTVAALRESRWHAWTLGRSAVPPGLAGEEAGLADLAVLSYVIGELPDPLRQEAVATAMAAASTVLVVEPGTPAGHRRVLAARDQLQGEGFRVAAPCPHQGPCPLTGDDWCHLPARVERSALHRAVKGAELSSEDEKFSYVLATRLPVEPYAARVIRHPMIRKGLVGLPLCQADGTAAQRLVSKRQGAAYKEARKLDWGDALQAGWSAQA